MVVRELLTRLGFSVDNGQLNKYERGVTNIKNSANEAANSFKQMFVAFAGFGALKSIARVADEMQSIQARLGMLPQSVEGSSAAFDHIAERADNAKQSISAYADFYTKAGNATQDFIKDQETLTKVVDGAAFGLAASGATAVAQGQAFFQLGQAIGSPIIQMEEMNTIIDVAPDLFRALGKAIPGANGNLKKFVSTGKVTGKMLASGLMTVLPQFEAKMKSMPLTIGQATQMMGNKWDAFINRINRSSGAVTFVANLMLGAFDDVSAGLDSMTEFFGGATNTLKFFAITITAAVIPALVRLGAGMIAFLVSPAGLIFLALTAVGLAMEDFYVWMKGGDSVLGDIFGSSEAFRESLQGLWQQIKDVGKAINDAFDFRGIFQNLIRFIAGAQGMLFGLMRTFKALGYIIAAALHFDPAGVIEGTKQLLDSLGQFERGAGNLVYGTMGVAQGVAGGAYNLSPLGPSKVNLNAIPGVNKGFDPSVVQHTLNVNVRGNTAPEILGQVKSGIQDNGTAYYLDRMIQVQGQ